MVTGSVTPWCSLVSTLVWPALPALYKAGCLCAWPALDPASNKLVAHSACSSAVSSAPAARSTGRGTSQGHIDGPAFNSPPCLAAPLCVPRSYLLVPGHTDGQIVLLHPPSRLLLASGMVAPSRGWLGLLLGSSARGFDVAGPGFSSRPDVVRPAVKRVVTQVGQAKSGAARGALAAGLASSCVQAGVG